ncbi:RNA polymerase sigma factor [Paenibacillus chitinolyticus]|uniref:Sigma-70 family RNA polymerase sigma factor n=1 Tax=Paenibacillus chitinolyticus TaxID=79263 RepID=A0ABT4FJH8_9BACL|nr:sigma-70 family RNA polymerase sigma factor [Paenibacillus chitinolyticus]MCY9590770.1 sigma-70 family RNA polymerase sigma factor [Paenibacillus chitinolyticus]MCY9598677.1 sigma-70 family RNA polymerase sigma factor [Paenibacillus chitinolyticus]
MKTLNHSIFPLDFRNLNPDSQRSIINAFYELAYQNAILILKDRSLAEDAAHDTLIKVLECGPNLKHDHNIKSWIRQVARNAAYDIIRKNKKYDYSLRHEKVINNLHSQSTEEFVEILLRNECLLKNIDELRDDYRVLIKMRYMDEMPYKIIAGKLNISESVLSKRVERAKKQLISLFIHDWEPL